MLTGTQDRPFLMPSMDPKIEINVISIYDFERIARGVFDKLLVTLGRSFGPYGSQTIIYKHPFSHISKDGFTIAQSLSMNVAETYTPEAIMNMALSICGRMNSAVGDGTTTAIVSTSNIYRSYLERKDELKDTFLPRDVLYTFNIVKDKIRKMLEEETTPIVGDGITNDMLAESIRKIVSISSNGDESITNTIVDLYRQLGFPAITCEKSKDGEERARLINGFSLKMYITDEMYINNDEKTMELDHANVLVFGCKMTKDIFNGIVAPVWKISKASGIKLIVAAPSWDEVLIDRNIAPSLRKEYRAKRDVSLVVAAYKASNIYQKKAAEDFAMLCHTELIDRARAMELMEKTNLSCDTVVDMTPAGEVEHPSIYTLLNMRRPYIPHVPFPVIVKNPAPNPEDEMSSEFGVQLIIHDREDAEELKEITKYDEKGILVPGSDAANEMLLDIGYVENIVMGLDSTIARKFYYDDAMHQLHLREAESNLEKVTQKYKKLGTFNTELSKAQERVYSLRMKMATIEVGGNSELSMGLRKDIYDDAIHAAESAYKYGVINGCNVSTIRCIMKLLTEIQNSEDSYQKSLQEPVTRIILSGFMDTYRKVLTNWVPDTTALEYIVPEEGTMMKDYMNKGYANTVRQAMDAFFKRFIYNVSPINSLYELFGCKKESEEKSRNLFDAMMYRYIQQIISYSNTPVGETHSITVFDILMMHSADTNQVFDLTAKQFSSDIINSFQTDDEILNAVVDLLSLLISGNQMVVTQKQSFEN